MRVLVACFVLLLAVCSQAVLDLQVLSKYRASGLVSTQGRHVSRGPGNTAYISGTLGSDVFVAQVEPFGSILRYVSWDSPQSNLESVISMAVASDGSVTLFIKNEIQRTAWVVRFSSSLQLQWERAFPQPGQFSMWGDTGSAGVSYLVIDEDANSQYGITAIGANGSVLATANRTLVLTNLVGVSAFPAPATGIALYGSAGSQAAVSTLAPNANVGWERIYGQPSNQSVYLDGLARSDGAVWLVGNYRETSASPDNAIYGWATQSVNGVLSTSAYRSIQRIVPETATRAYALAGSIASGRRVVVALTGMSTLSTDILLRKELSFTNITSLGYVPEMEAVWGGTESQGPFAHSANIDMIASGPSPTRLSTVSDSVGIGVSSSLGVTQVHMLDEGGFSRQDHVLVGSPIRNITSRLALPDGSLILTFVHANFSKNEVAVVKYRPDGTIAFARTLGSEIENGGFGARLVLSTDGLVWVLFDGKNQNLTVMKLNASGVPFFTRTFNTPGDLIGAIPGANGEVFGFTYAQQRLIRIQSNGYIAFTRSFGSTSFDSLTFKGFRLANGHIAFALWQNGLNTLRLFQVDPADGGVLYSSTVANDVLESHTALDPNGHVVLAYRTGTSFVLRRRSGANLATQLSAASFPNIDALDAFAITPTGKPVCVVSSTSSVNREMRTLGSNFAFSNTSDVEPSVARATEIVSDASGQIYLVGRETVGATNNVYVAKYLANGARSAQRRLAGDPRGIDLYPNGVWVSGEVKVRNQGQSPFAARFSL